MKTIPSLLMLLFSCLFFTCRVVAVPLDYDSDLRSNLSSVTINSDNSLSWMYQSGAQNTVEDLAAFGVAGNHLMPGYYTASETIPGVVSKNGVWRFANGVKRNFGSESDLFIGGGDYDGNGLSDIAHVTNACTRQKASFRTILNPSQSDVQSDQIAVGKGNQYKFFYDADSDGKDDICFLKPLKRSRVLTDRFRTICKSVQTGRRIRSIRLGRVFAQPQTLRTDTGVDFILLHRKRANKTSLKLISSSGRVIFKHVVNDSGTLVVGNFSTTAIEEIAIVKNALATIVTPLSGSERRVNYPAGVPYDITNIEHFSNNQDCFCNSQIIRKNGACVASPDSGEDETGGGGSDSGSLFIPDNCSNPPEHITWNDGFKCIASETRGGSVVCLLPYHFTWAPHRSTTDHHGYRFACNSNDDHFSKVELILNNGQRIGLSYSGCHNYVATSGGNVGRQHFRNEAIKWTNIQNSVRTIEMSRGNRKTCLRF